MIDLLRVSYFLILTAIAYAIPIGFAYARSRP